MGSELQMININFLKDQTNAINNNKEDDVKSEDH